jgi:hypothetical protein
MSDESRRADRAYVARLRWRATLHRLNSDEPGAQLNESHAATLERFCDAREAVAANPDDPAAGITLETARVAVQTERRAWREVRNAFGASMAATIDDFAEPSDTDLLEWGA